MSFDENNIIFKQYFIPDKYDKSLIFSKTLQDYIAGIKGLIFFGFFKCNLNILGTGPVIVYTNILVRRYL